MAAAPMRYPGRRLQRDKVLAVLNFSKETHAVKFEDGPYAGTYTDYFSGERVQLSADTRLQLNPWEFRVFVK